MHHQEGILLHCPPAVIMVTACETFVANGPGLMRQAKDSEREGKPVAQPNFFSEWWAPSFLARSTHACPTPTH